MRPRLTTRFGSLYLGVVMSREPGRNEPCPCGSGLKYKKCHGDIVKIQSCQQAALKLMQELITEEVSKKESEVVNDGNGS